MAQNDPLALPSPEKLREIAAKQDAKAAELRELRKQPSSQDPRELAAKLIQKNYRGYRTRRSIQGYGLDSSARWTELLKEAKYYNTTSPASREMHAIMSPTSELQTRARWDRVRTIASHAGGDNTSSEDDLNGDSPEELAKLRERKRKQKSDRYGFLRSI